MAWVLAGVLAVIVMIQALKIRSLQQSAREIAQAFAERLNTDTNTLIDISCRDKHMLSLADSINQQLKLLRKQRQQYLTGDRELKEAVSNISHDLRTPLTAICGYLDLLEKEETSENAARYIGQIRNRSEALKQLTEELFRYSVIASIPEVTAEKVDVCRALEESLVSYYAALQQRGITPDIHLPETAVWRNLDPAALHRVFGNVIGNAIKYSDGDLRVVMTEDGTVTFSNTAAELSAVDVGKLFNRFFTVDSARRSTGLGLSIAKLLVERMNGSIAADYKDSMLHIVISFSP